MNGDVPKLKFNITVDWSKVKEQKDTGPIFETVEITSDEVQENYHQLQGDPSDYESDEDLRNGVIGDYYTPG